MNNQPEKIRHTLARAMEIPRDLALNLPKMILTGNVELEVENHLGLIEFTGEKILFNTHQGAVEVKGQNLSIRYILIYELAIEGQIDSVAFLR